MKAEYPHLELYIEALYLGIIRNEVLQSMASDTG